MRRRPRSIGDDNEETRDEAWERGGSEVSGDDEETRVCCHDCRRRLHERARLAQTMNAQTAPTRGAQMAVAGDEVCVRERASDDHTRASGA